jgi:hypothetical protein
MLKLALVAVLVTFHQSGGFAGIDRGYTVQRSGAVVSNGAPHPRLSPAALKTLRDALAAARFSTLRRVYEPAQPVADGFSYRIAYAGRTVRIEQGAKLPPRLQRVFVLLERLTRSS